MASTYKGEVLLSIEMIDKEDPLFKVDDFT